MSSARVGWTCKPSVSCAVDPLAEVDGNRTRLMGIAHDNRFEGGGAHQVLVHLRRQP